MARPTTPKKVFGGLFAALGLGLLIYAGVLAGPPTETTFYWKQADALVRGTRLEKLHDSAGKLYYGVQVLVDYDAEGKHFGTAVSSIFKTSRYAAIVAFARRFKIGVAVPLRYPPGHPDDARVDSGFTAYTCARIGTCAGFGLLSFGVSALFLFFRPARYCDECGEAVARSYRFCPNCAATLSGG